MVPGSGNMKRAELLSLIRETPITMRYEVVMALIEAMPSDEERNAFYQEIMRVFNLLDRVEVIKRQ